MDGEGPRFEGLCGGAVGAPRAMIPCGILKCRDPRRVRIPKLAYLYNVINLGACVYYP